MPDPGKEREGAARRIWRRSRGRHAVPEEEEQGPPLPDLAPCRPRPLPELAPRRPPPLPELEPKFTRRPAGGPGKPPPLLTTGEGRAEGGGEGRHGRETASRQESRGRRQI